MSNKGHNIGEVVETGENNVAVGNKEGLKTLKDMTKHEWEGFKGHVEIEELIFQSH